MPDVLLTYDISDKHILFKQALLDKDYRDQILGSNGSTNLPNTTLYHPNKTAIASRDDARAIANSLAVSLERCFAVEFVNNWAGLIGDKHAS